VTAIESGRAIFFYYQPMASTSTTSLPTDKAPSKILSLLRSILAVFLGFVAVVVLSLGTDQILHVLNVYPPWGQPMNDTSDNLLALAYRCVYGVIGSYITARTAPHSPMLHIWIGAAIGLVLGSLGVFAAMQMNLGPLWYPILLALSAIPCAWIAGRLHHRRHIYR
jgi:hypothetical protein